jgi:hypothetical protein
MGDLQQDLIQLVFAALWPLIQQWMTGSGLTLFRWIGPRSSGRLKFAISATAAALSTAGLHLAHSGSAAAGSQLTLTIPPIAVLGHAALALLVQHLVYWLAVKNRR